MLSHIIAPSLTNYDNQITHWIAYAFLESKELSFLNYVFYLITIFMVGITYNAMA